MGSCSAGACSATRSGQDGKAHERPAPPSAVKYDCLESHDLMERSDDDDVGRGEAPPVGMEMGGDFDSSIATDVALVVVVVVVEAAASKDPAEEEADDDAASRRRRWSRRRCR